MNTPRRDDGMDLVDYVRELTCEHQHREHYNLERTNRDGSTTWFGQHHATRVPPLIAQLVHATPSGAVQERDNSGYQSRPTARLDALDTLTHIDQAAARWVRWLGHDDPGDKINPRTGNSIPGTGLIACLRLLVGIAPSLDKRTRAELTTDVRRWWTWSRIVSGWDSPAWRPDNTCPMCGERRSLRINLVGQVAFCVNEPCRETWDASNIGLLADHIRLESEQERVPPVRPVACQCRWPMQPRDHGRWGMCPVCGSALCLNAEAVAEREDQRRRAAREAARLEQLERIAQQYRRADVRRGA